MSDSGHGALAGRKVLVAGGTGDVGEGIVRQALAAGADVVVPARSPERAALLQERVPHPRLSIVEAAFSVPEEADALRRRLREYGPLDGIVASIGGWHQGPLLLETTPDAWQAMLGSHLTPHFALARAFLRGDALVPHGTYVQVLGIAAEQAVPRAGPVSITAAAVDMLGRVLQAESQSGGPRVCQLMIRSPVATRRRERVRPEWPTADDVGRAAVGLLADAHSPGRVALDARASSAG